MERLEWSMKRENKSMENGEKKDMKENRKGRKKK